MLSFSKSSPSLEKPLQRSFKEGFDDLSSPNGFSLHFLSLEPTSAIMQCLKTNKRSYSISFFLFCLLSLSSYVMFVFCYLSSCRDDYQI